MTPPTASSRRWRRWNRTCATGPIRSGCSTARPGPARCGRVERGLHRARRALGRRRGDGHAAQLDRRPHPAGPVLPHGRGPGDRRAPGADGDGRPAGRDRASVAPYLPPYRSGLVLFDGKPVGVLGEVHPKVPERFGAGADRRGTSERLDGLADGFVDRRGRWARTVWRAGRIRRRARPQLGGDVVAYGFGIGLETLAVCLGHPWVPHSVPPGSFPRPPCTTRATLASVEVPGADVAALVGADLARMSTEDTVTQRDGARSRWFRRSSPPRPTWTRWPGRRRGLTADLKDVWPRRAPTARRIGSDNRCRLVMSRSSDEPGGL